PAVDRLWRPGGLDEPAQLAGTNALCATQPFPLSRRQQPRKLGWAGLGNGAQAAAAGPGTADLLSARPCWTHRVRGRSTYRPANAAGPKDCVRSMVSGEITIRVRYAETDRMGLVHHANYLVYFEQGRTELLRSQGLAYKDFEDQGYLLVITRAEVRYRSPARYDDLLTLRTTVARTTAVRIDHRYELLREGTLIAEGSTPLACVDREGRVQALPTILKEQ